MTAAKPNHKAARALMLQYLDLHPGQTVNADLDPLEAGIVGDAAHAGGGDSYHLGADQIRARGGRNRYSVDESSRDKAGLDDYASGVDFGYFAVTVGGRTWDLYDFNEWLIALCKAGDPDTRDLREVIYSPDGRTVKRWDALGYRTGGDSSHRTHTHLSEFRDADGHRMLRLATRWLQHIGLIPLEDDMPTAKEIAEAVWNHKEVDPADPAQVTGTKPAALRMGGWARYEKVRADNRQKNIVGAVNTVLVAMGKDQVDEQAIVTGVLAGLDPAAIAAAIPDDIARQVADELAGRLQA